MLWFMIAVSVKALIQLRIKDRFRYSVCLGALAGLFAVCIHSAFDFGLHIPVNRLVFTCLVVIATASYRNRSIELIREQVDF